MKTSQLSEEAQRELLALAEAGALTPKNTVDRARDPASPLHAHFTWDDGEAAELYRQQEARAIIRVVKVEITFRDRLYEAPKYVHDPGTRDQGYIPTVSLRNDREGAEAAVRRELSRALSCVKRAESIAAAAGIAIDVDEIAAQLTGLSARPKTVADVPNDAKEQELAAQE